MRLGILTTGIGSYGKKGFYNAQEIGLAKEMDKLFEEVIVYKAIPKTEAFSSSKIEGCKNTTLYQLPVKNQGINGMWDCKRLDASLDVLLYFSDTQLILPSVYKWCARHNVILYPYIGVCESHSNNWLKKLIIDGLFLRNLSVYRKCICFAKTPTVKEQLALWDVNNVTVTPVGLDMSLLFSDVKSKSEVREKLGFGIDKEIFLFIGRMTIEKQPLKMIELFKNIYQSNKKAELIMIGKGELLNEVKIQADGFPVTFIEQIRNDLIWQYYVAADYFVNLNDQEIFGMAILEAMYYGCKVVAWNAPGPNYIIKNGFSGFLVNSDSEAITCMLQGKLDTKDIHKYVVDCFTWNHTAKIMSDIMKGGQ